MIKQWKTTVLWLNNDGHYYNSYNDYNSYVEALFE